MTDSVPSSVVEKLFNEVSTALDQTIDMQIKLIAIGKTDNKSLISLIEDYTKRLGFYINFEFEVIPDLKKVKNLSEAQQKEKEGELIL